MHENPLTDSVDVGYFFGDQAEAATQEDLVKYVRRGLGIEIRWEVLECQVLATQPVLGKKTFCGPNWPGSVRPPNSSPKVPPLYKHFKFGNKQLDAPGQVAVVYIPLSFAATSSIMVGSFGEWAFTCITSDTLFVECSEPIPYTGLPNWGIVRMESVHDEEKDNFKPSVEGQEPVEMLHSPYYQQIKRRGADKTWLAVILKSVAVFPKMHFSKCPIESIHSPLLPPDPKKLQVKLCKVSCYSSSFSASYAPGEPSARVAP